MNNLERDIGKILASLEGIKEAFEKHVQDDKEVAKRVTSLERDKWVFTGVFSTIAVLWTVFGDYVAKAAGFK